MAWWRFGRDKNKTTPAVAADNEDLLERIYNFLSDESRQNEGMPQWLREEVSRAPSIDQVPGGTGEFGRNANNPIPVNGPFGEAQYLSSLITDAGQPIAFQRIGSLERVDVYETVGFDGREWDVLHLTKYFPRKSTIAPRGFRFARKDEQPALIKGVNDQEEDFPYAIYPRVARYTQRILGVPIADPRLRAFDTLQYRVPEDHLRALDHLRFGGRPSMSNDVG